MIIDALTRLHYGAPYLDAVIRSTEGLAERHWVVYAELHNFPGDPTTPCPDTREQLYEIARIAGGDRLRWVDHPAPGVDVVLREHPEIDALLELDSDEVCHQDLAADIKRRVEAGELTAKRYRVPMIHHWRSFRYGCTDGQWPIRLYLPKSERDEVAWYERMTPNRYIHHMGYAISRAHMEYKWMLSIHRQELRSEWFSEIYDKFPERLVDVHPVSKDMWNADPIDLGELPACLITHPYRFLEVVE
jgi:hypothetical protein